VGVDGRDTLMTVGAPDCMFSTAHGVGLIKAAPASEDATYTLPTFDRRLH